MSSLLSSLSSSSLSSLSGSVSQPCFVCCSRIFSSLVLVLVDVSDFFSVRGRENGRRHPSRWSGFALFLEKRGGEVFEEEEMVGAHRGAEAVSARSGGTQYLFWGRNSHQAVYLLLIKVLLCIFCCFVASVCVCGGQERGQVQKMSRATFGLQSSALSHSCRGIDIVVAIGSGEVGHRHVNAALPPHRLASRIVPSFPLLWEGEATRKTYGGERGTLSKRVSPRI